MRIIQFCPYYPPHQWWLETYLFEWSAEWRKVYGNETLLNVIFVTTETSIPTENDNDIIVPAFEVVHNFPFPKLWKISFWKAIRRIIGFKPTHLLTHTRFFVITLFGWIVSMLVSAKWVHTEHGSDFVVADSALVSRISRWYDLSIGRWCLRHADTVIAISQATSDFVCKLSGIISVVNYPWVTLPPYLPRLSEPMEARKLPIRIIFAGRLVQLKWCHIFLNALWILSQKQKKKISKIDIEVDIFWDGPELTRLQEMAKNTPLTINFRGSVSREILISDIYPSSDILVVPSLQEGLGLTGIEWLSLGMVVIASDVWWLPEISDREDLILFPREDVMALSDAITWAIQDLDRIRGMSAEWVREKFSWERNVEKYFELFNETS